MAWLLDTNAWIRLLKTASSPIADRLAKLNDGDVSVCSVVKAELWHGANKYANRT